jgi:hypothetical protein
LARDVLVSRAMISTSDGRRAPRWSARIAVRYQVFEPQDGELSLGELDAARARDIGSDGLFLSGVDQPLGTRLHFFFELPESRGGCIEAFGEVVHAGPRLDATGFEIPGVGVRILRISPRNRARLERYLDERQAIDAACLSAAQVRVRAERRLRGDN